LREPHGKLVVVRNAKIFFLLELIFGSFEYEYFAKNNFIIHLPSMMWLSVAKVESDRKWCQALKLYAKTDAQMVKTELIIARIVIFPGAGVPGKLYLDLPVVVMLQNKLNMNFRLLKAGVCIEWLDLEGLH
jgi:hypothetical protein